MLPLFELHQVSRYFGEFAALADLSFNIQPGERVALVGPSGAGKTTLINLLNGSLMPSKGEIYLLDEDPTHLSTSALRRIQQQIGTVHQQFELVGNLKVIHNVNAGRLGGWPTYKAAWSLLLPQGRDDVTQILKRVGIPEKLFEQTGSLSGGQQQRVAIARVLMQDPVVILADEPISSLDPGRSRAIMKLLYELVLESSKTLVVSLHEIDYALEFCNRIIGMREGRILFDRVPEDITQVMVDNLYQIEAV